MNLMLIYFCTAWIVSLINLLCNWSFTFQYIILIISWQLSFIYINSNSFTSQFRIIRPGCWTLSLFSCYTVLVWIFLQPLVIPAFILNSLISWYIPVIIHLLFTSSVHCKWCVNILVSYLKLYKLYNKWFKPSVCKFLFALVQHQLLFLIWFHLIWSFSN